MNHNSAEESPVPLWLVVVLIAAMVSVLLVQFPGLRGVVMYVLGIFVAALLALSPILVPAMIGKADAKKKENDPAAR